MGWNDEWIRNPGMDHSDEVPFAVGYLPWVGGPLLVAGLAAPSLAVGLFGAVVLLVAAVWWFRCSARRVRRARATEDAAAWSSDATSWPTGT